MSLGSKKTFNQTAVFEHWIIDAGKSDYRTVSLGAAPSYSLNTLVHLAVAFSSYYHQAHYQSAELMIVVLCLRMIKKKPYFEHNRTSKFVDTIKIKSGARETAAIEVSKGYPPSAVNTNLDRKFEMTVPARKQGAAEALKELADQCDRSDEDEV